MFSPKYTACLLKLPETKVIVLMVFNWMTNSCVYWMAAQAAVALLAVDLQLIGSFSKYQSLHVNLVQSG